MGRLAKKNIVRLGRSTPAGNRWSKWDVVRWQATKANLLSRRTMDITFKSCLLFRLDVHF